MPSDLPPLLGGPYAAPAAHIGDHLMDEIHGLVPVGRWSDGPIAWPCRRKTGKASLILTGDLVSAIRRESAEAIRAYWGVSGGTVWKWRKALGVEPVTDGTRHLLQTRTGVPPDAAARGRKAAAQPDALHRMAMRKRGRPAHPKTKAALLRASKACKPKGWGARANTWMLKGKKEGPPR